MSKMEGLNLDKMQNQEECLTSSSGNLKESIEEIEESNIWSQYQLAEEYGENKIVMQVKNPTSAHIYWEFTTEQANHILAKLGYQDLSQVALILRLYDLTISKEYDINTTLEHRDWYINELNPGHNYLVKLGIIDNETKFHPIVESNPIKTPRNTVSDNLDEEWMIVEDKLEKIYLLSGKEELAERGYSSPEVIKKEERVFNLSRLEEGYSSFSILKGSSEIIE
ncbi:DUF4912 domain-containing protein [Natroniella sulfidigena]|uniref:DUF4912 domain-containing protein n=1 Tax=Natroniella sulfidigena TaxID=723921 RepID=UPI00200AADF2|nr:DUF4912 domain-containing protein [Natroniella sulfidigena]MCK8817322.1 DUF4912 domain-containing protein [Natroniella sulfidigena]